MVHRVISRNPNINAASLDHIDQDPHHRGALKLLEAVRVHKSQSGQKIRYCQSSTIETIALVQEIP